VASKLAVQHKNKSSPMDCFFVFGCNEAQLRCMKNEAAFGYEALLRNMKNEKRALRFIFAK